MGKTVKRILDPGQLIWKDEVKVPKPPKISSPEELNAEAAAAAEEELRRRRRGGRGTTILTSGLEAPTLKKTLLGQ
jgi:hypothetical protein